MLLSCLFQNYHTRQEQFAFSLQRLKNIRNANLDHAFGLHTKTPEMIIPMAGHNSIFLAHGKCTLLGAIKLELLLHIDGKL